MLMGQIITHMRLRMLFLIDPMIMLASLKYLFLLINSLVLRNKEVNYQISVCVHSFSFPKLYNENINTMMNVAELKINAQIQLITKSK